MDEGQRQPDDEKRAELALKQWAALEEASFTFEGHLVGAYGIFITFLLGAVILVGDKPPTTNPTLYRYLFIVMSIASDFFFVMASYLGFAKARIGGYTRLILEPIVNRAFGSLLQWEEFKRPPVGTGKWRMLRLFVRHGHSLFVVYICLASACASLIGIAKFIQLTTGSKSWDALSVFVLTAAVAGLIYALSYYLFATAAALLNVYQDPGNAASVLLLKCSGQAEEGKE